MRTFAAIILLGNFMVSTLAQSLPNVPFRSDLTCGACAIGGYRFCYRGNADTECCRVDDIDCQTKNNRGCTSPDRFRAVFGDCNRGNFRNMVLCGNNGVRQIDNTTSLEQFNLQ